MIYKQFIGKVIHGNEIGRTIGFPTANLALENGTIPPNGVYCVKILLLKKHYFGIMNVGTRPSLNLKDISVEVHILDFNSNIYNKPIEIQPLIKIRNEIRFDSIQALQCQLQKDELFARNFIANL